MKATVRILEGKEIADALGELARLRITVFAEYPYLYDGDEEYEAEYVREFAQEPGSVLVAAFDGGRMIGAATASPMEGQKEEFRRPFRECGYEVSRIFYFGESVLLPQYRGQGIGHAFFDYREAAARAAGAVYAAFAAVVRPEDHKARSGGYRAHDAFWTRRGYAKAPGLVTELAWKDHGEEGETLKPMQYWMRAL